MIKAIAIVSLALFSVACTAENGRNGTDGKDGINGTDGKEIVTEAPADAPAPSTKTGMYQRTETNVFAAANSAMGAVAFCDRATDVLVAGGCSSDSSVQINSSYPANETTTDLLASWQCLGTSSAIGAKITAYIVCMPL